MLVFTAGAAGVAALAIGEAARDGIGEAVRDGIGEAALAIGEAALAIGEAARDTGGPNNGPIAGI